MKEDTTSGGVSPFLHRRHGQDGTTIAKDLTLKQMDSQEFQDQLRGSTNEPRSFVVGQCIPVLVFVVKQCPSAQCLSVPHDADFIGSTRKITSTSTLSEGTAVLHGQNTRVVCPVTPTSSFSTSITAALPPGRPLARPPKLVNFLERSRARKQIAKEDPSKVARMGKIASQLPIKRLQPQLKRRSNKLKPTTEIILSPDEALFLEAACALSSRQLSTTLIPSSTGSKL